MPTHLAFINIDLLDCIMDTEVLTFKSLQLTQLYCINHIHWYLPNTSIILFHAATDDTARSSIICHRSMGLVRYNRCYCSVIGSWIIEGLIGLSVGVYVHTIKMPTLVENDGDSFYISSFID